MVIESIDKKVIDLNLTADQTERVQEIINQQVTYCKYEGMAFMLIAMFATMLLMVSIRC